MANGIFLLKNKEKNDPELISKYIKSESEKDVSLSKEIFKRILTKHGIYEGTEELNNSMSYRAKGFKYLSIYLLKTEEGENIFLVFILGEKESAEPFSIMINDLYRSIKTCFEKDTKGKIDVLKEVLDNRNDLVADILDVKRIQSRLVAKANTLLDEGNFEKAQELIKYGKEIPNKIAALVVKSNEAFTAKNYKSAQKTFNDAAELAKKINQYSMIQLFRKNAKRAEDIPKFLKNWAILYELIVKPLKKMEKRERSFYLAPIRVIEQLIEISDMLEDDTTIMDLQNLEDCLVKANDLSNELDEVDTKISELLGKLKNNKYQ